MDGRIIMGYYVLIPIFSTLIFIVLGLAIRENRWQVYLGFAWAVVLMIVFFVLGFGFNWIQGTELELCEGGIPCFCEGYLDSPIKQPVSVWSDLAFMASGMFVFYLASRQAASGSNPLASSSSWLPFALGFIIIFMGPASMIYHASIKLWAGWFDNMSIVIWLAFCLWYSLMRLFRWSEVIFVIAYVLTLLVIGTINWIFPDIRTYWVLGLGVIWGVLELIVVIMAATGNPWNGVVRSWLWYVLLLGTFAVAIAVWIPSGGVVTEWCPQESAIQPHGIWHILSGVVTLFSYYYLASETTA